MDVNAAQMAGWLAGALSIVGYIPYIWSIITGQARSAGQLTSWLIWSLEYSALTAALIHAGQPDAIWLPAAELAGTVITAVLVFWRREPGIDWGQVGIYAAGTAGGLILWAVSGNPYFGVAVILAVDGTGIVLTIRGAYTNPGGELPEAWALWSAAGVAGCAAAAGGDPMAYAFPAFLAVTCAGVGGAAWAGEHRRAPGRHEPGAPPAGDVISAGWADGAPLRRVSAAPTTPGRAARRYAVPGVMLAACAVAAFLLAAPPPPAVHRAARSAPVVTGRGSHPYGPARPGVVKLEKMWVRSGPVLADDRGRVLYKCPRRCPRLVPVMGATVAAAGFHLTGRLGRTAHGQATYRGAPLYACPGQAPGRTGGLARGGELMRVSAVGLVAVASR